MKQRNLFLSTVFCFVFFSLNTLGQSVQKLNEEEYETTLDLANLSARVYDNMWDQALDVIAPTLFPDLDFIGNTTHYTEIENYDQYGLHAVLFQNTYTGDYVLAFRGTDAFSARDWIADINQALSNYIRIPTKQYNLAVKIAKELKDEYGEEDLILTGHSLGGGLAQTAALANGLRAICFDAAGITRHTLKTYGITSKLLNMNKKEIVHVNVRWSPLTDLDGFMNTKSPFYSTRQHGGKTIWLRGMPGTALIINPTRVVNHLFHSLVLQLTHKKFLNKNPFNTTKKAIVGEFVASGTELTLFPNPTSDHLNVVLNNQEVATLSIVSLNGHVLQTFEMSNSENQFDVSMLQAGMYIVRVQLESEVIQRRLIKQ